MKSFPADFHYLCCLFLISEGQQPAVAYKKDKTLSPQAIEFNLPRNNETTPTKNLSFFTSMRPSISPFLGPQSVFVIRSPLAGIYLRVT